jgi:hypothetical protein
LWIQRQLEEEQARLEAYEVGSPTDIPKTVQSLMRTSCHVNGPGFSAVELELEVCTSSLRPFFNALLSFHQ